MAALTATQMFWASMAASAASTAIGVANSNATAKAQAATQAQQKQALDREYAQAEEQRQERLARTQAAQRAAFAASGISGDGSAGALMNNLLAESEEERSRLAESYNNGLAELQAGARVNLLKQRANTATSLVSLAQRGLENNKKYFGISQD